MSYKAKRDDASPFDPYLVDDETLLWWGQPNPKMLFSAFDLYVIPFTLIWCYVSFPAVSGLFDNRPSFSPIGLLFLVVGQYMLWGRFLHKYLRRKQSYYAITNRRALIMTRLMGNSLKTFLLSQIAGFDLQGHSILFEADPNERNRIVFPAPTMKMDQFMGEPKPGFYALPDPESVFEILQGLLINTKVKRSSDTSDLE